MTKSRMKKIAAAVPRTEQAITDLLSLIASQQLDKEKWIAERDAKLKEAAGKIEAEFQFDAKISAAELHLAHNLELAEAWAELNREQFGKLKSLRKNGFTIGWRLGNWKSATTGSKWDEIAAHLAQLISDASDEVMKPEPDAQIVELGALAGGFLRIVKSCDRARMIEHRDDEKCAALWPLLGVVFEQDESFYLDPDREGQEGKTLVAE